MIEWGISTVTTENRIRGISIVGRTRVLYCRPQNDNLIDHGALAQLVARNVRIVEVRGSNPLCSTTTEG